MEEHTGSSNGGQTLRIEKITRKQFSTRQLIPSFNFENFEIQESGPNCVFVDEKNISFASTNISLTGFTPLYPPIREFTERRWKKAAHVNSAWITPRRANCSSRSSRMSISRGYKITGIREWNHRERFDARSRLISSINEDGARGNGRERQST